MNNMNLVELLIKNKLKIATAESFTGGLLGSTIVSMPHASNCYLGGIITYTKEAKCLLLDMNMLDIEKYSVYSSYTAREMASSIMRKTNSNIAIGTTGVAGPGDDEGVREGSLFYCIKYNDIYYDRYIELNLGRNENRKEATRIIIEDLINIINK